MDKNKESWIIITVAVVLIFAAFNLNCSNAQVTMTAGVEYNNCNIHTTTMPAPEISHTWENEWGYNFMGWIGSSPFYALRTENRLTFYLDSASWYTDGLQVYFSNCNKQ